MAWSSAVAFSWSPDGLEARRAAIQPGRVEELLSPFGLPPSRNSHEFDAPAHLADGPRTRSPGREIADRIEPPRDLLARSPVCRSSKASRPFQLTSPARPFLEA
jgi:hypothetical protein